MRMPLIVDQRARLTPSGDSAPANPKGATSFPPPSFLGEGGQQVPNAPAPPPSLPSHVGPRRAPSAATPRASTARLNDRDSNAELKAGEARGRLRAASGPGPGKPVPPSSPSSSLVLPRRPGS